MDQFLEHIFEYNENIVRIGGRSKSEKLKDRLIYELRKNDIGRGPSGVGKLYRKREELADKINDIIVEMYEEPCVTIDFIEKQKLLRPRQIEELKRLGQREEKLKTNFALEANGDTMDDDDLWVITSQPTVKPESPHINNNRSKNNNNNNKSKRNQKNQSNADDWLNGNLNLQTEAEKSINPVEVWLQDAIEYVGSHDIYASYVEDLKDEFLEQKGLVYEDDNNEDELMDEEEMQEIAQNYFDGQDLRGNKNRYVNIGKAYKNKVNNTPNAFTFNMFGNMQQHNLYNNDPNGRKIINYEKTDRATRIASEQFDFFNDGNDLSYQQQHEILERWMKNDEVTMWPLAVRLKAHKKWAALRRKEYEKQLNTLIDEYNKTTVDIRKKTVLNDAKICKENRVIGMTSTAAVNKK